MAEPDNHTHRLLREIRGAVSALDLKVDKNHAELTERIENLRQAAFGESVLGRYAAAEVEDRLAAIEKRLSVLEKRK
jgi:hypothetical protein